MKNVKELLVTAEGYLKKEDFARARAVYLKISTSEPSCFDAHWGLLLCSRFLTDDAELIAVGAPIDRDPHYIAARRCESDSKGQTRLSRAYYGIAATMRAKLLRSLAAGDLAVASLWQARIEENKTYLKKYAAAVEYSRAARISGGFVGVVRANADEFFTAVGKIEASDDGEVKAILVSRCDAMYSALCKRIALRSAVEQAFNEYSIADRLRPSAREHHLALLGVYEKGNSNCRMPTFDTCLAGALAGADSEEAAAISARATRIREEYEARLRREAMEQELARRIEIIEKSERALERAKNTADLTKRAKDLQTTASELSSIAGFRNANELCEAANELLSQTEREIARRERCAKAKRATGISSLVVAILAVIAFGVYWFVELGPSIKYSDAEELLAAGEYREAIVKFSDLGDYRDAASRLTEARYLYALSLIDSGKSFEAYTQLAALGSYRDAAQKKESLTAALDAIAPGDMVRFGSYEQNGQRGDGEEQIKWIVLAREGDVLLLVSYYVLDAGEMHGNLDDFMMSYVDWEKTDLCEWLNDDFYEDAFDEVDCGIIADPNGETTVNEKLTRPLFLPSRQEFDLFFAPVGAPCAPTATATERALDGEPYVESGNLSSWWLRGGGWGWGDCSAVSPSGTVSIYYNPTDIYGVRPCVRVDLSK